MNKKGILIIIAIIILIALFVVTCPNKAAHKEAIKTVTNELIDKKTSDSGLDAGGWGSLIAGALGNRLIEVLLDSKLSVDNYLLFSVGTIHFGDKTKTVSFGCLNHVFTFSEDDLEKAMNGDGTNTTTGADKQ